MPYLSLSRLEDMIQPEACEATASQIADAGTDRFQANVRRNTPIDTNPYRGRPGRPRGFARESIERGLVRRTSTPAGPAFRGSVFTEDDVFPYIEWDTPPHVIRPRADRAPASVVETRRPRGTVADGRASLSWLGPMGRVFAKIVHHPGTKGQHPFAIGAAITEAELDEIARGPLASWRLAVTRASVRSVDRRSR